MEARVQIINNDTILEVTETVVQKTRHSETDLQRQKVYFEEMIVKGQAGLDKVNALLAQIGDVKAIQDEITI